MINAFWCFHDSNLGMGGEIGQRDEREREKPPQSFLSEQSSLISTRMEIEVGQYKRSFASLANPQTCTTRGNRASPPPRSQVVEEEEEAGL